MTNDSHKSHKTDITYHKNDIFNVTLYVKGENIHVLIHETLKEGKHVRVGTTLLNKTQGAYITHFFYFYF